ncbi:MAG: hypothetical protein JZU49_02595 [Sulfuricurvum sp.]|nr:hypothetical protein [Sulfuricurvum sp.]
MENQKINTDINLVKEEMIAIWAYLDAYDKIFESTDNNQIKILGNIGTPYVFRPLHKPSIAIAYFPCQESPV